MQAALEQPLVGGRERRPQFAELVERRPAAQFEDDVLLGAGDDHVPADRPAALRHDGPQADLALEEHADGPLVEHAAAEEQAALARGPSCRWPCRP